MKQVIKKCECGTKISYKQTTCLSLFCKLFTKHGYYENGERKLNKKGLELHKIGYQNYKPNYNRKIKLISILEDLYNNKITAKKAIEVIKKM